MSRPHCLRPAPPSPAAKSAAPAGMRAAGVGRLPRGWRGRGQAGASLIEVLVSIFIVSMGVLAMAGLMTASARFSKTAEVRATAVSLAAGLADQLRANPAAVRAGAYTLRSRFPAPAVPAPAADACRIDAPCAPGARAEVDLARWRTQLRARLPNGSGVVRLHAGGAVPSADIWVAWTDPAPGFERQAGECPAELGTGADATVRCVHLLAALP